MSSNQFKMAVFGLIAVTGFVMHGLANADQDSAWFLTQVQLTDGYTPIYPDSSSPDKAAVAKKEESIKRPQDKVATTKPAK
jgi:hypothetical protein